MSNSLGLINSTFQADVAANLPVKFPGSGNIALFLATDTNALYIASNPGAPTTFGGDAPNATWVGLGGGGSVAIPDAATYTALVANSGRTHIFPDLTSSCTVTLPAPTAGLSFSFIGKAGAADAQSWVITAGAVLIKGGVLGMDTDAGAGADELVPAYANGSTHVKLTVATPDAGCNIRFIADGTNWLVSGLVSSAAAPVFGT